MADVQLPAGYTLDTDIQLPKGYTLDSDAQTSSAHDNQQKAHGFWSDFVRDVLPHTILGRYLGGTDIAQGVQDIQQPGVDPKLHAAHELATGAVKLTAPVTLPAVLAAGPGAAAVGLGAGLLGQQVGTGVAQSLGAPQGASELTGDVTGVLTGGIAGGLTSKLPSIKSIWQMAQTPEGRSLLIDLLPFNYGTKFNKIADFIQTHQEEPAAAPTVGPHPLEDRNPLRVAREPEPFDPTGGKGSVTYGPLTTPAGPQHPLETPGHPLAVIREPEPFDPTGGKGVVSYGPITASEAAPAQAPAGVSPEDWAQLPKNVQDAIAAAASKRAAGVNYRPASDISFQSPVDTSAIPVKTPPGGYKVLLLRGEQIPPPETPPPGGYKALLLRGQSIEPAEAPAGAPTTQVETPATAVESPAAEDPATSEGDWAGQLRAQVGKEIQTRKEVEAAIPSEAGNISPQEATARQQVADRGAKYLANQGLTPGRIEALRQTNPDMYQSLRDEVGSAKGVSKQKGYSPSDDTWDMMLERLALLEDQGKIGPKAGIVAQRSVPAESPAAKAAKVAKASQELADALKENP